MPVKVDAEPNLKLTPKSIIETIIFLMVNGIKKQASQFAANNIYEGIVLVISKFKILLQILHHDTKQFTLQCKDYEM